jgi:putative metallohydrolase (TIGR04338 family)
VVYSSAEGDAQVPNIQVTKFDRKVYEAEKSIPRGEQFTSMDAVRAYVRNITGSTWWRSRTVRHEIAVLSYKGTQFAYSSGQKAAIYLPEWGWNEATVLHELAHQLADSRHGYARHGALFLWWELELVDNFHSVREVGPSGDRVDIRTHVVEGMLASGVNPVVGGGLAERENKSLRAATVAEIGPVYRRGAPAGYIPLQWVGDRIQREGKTVSSLVRAMGGDKGLREPLAEWWRPVYAQGKRWLPRECLDHIDQLTDKKPRRERW